MFGKITIATIIIFGIANTSFASTLVSNNVSGGTVNLNFPQYIDGSFIADRTGAPDTIYVNIASPIVGSNFLTIDYSDPASGVATTTCGFVPAGTVGVTAISCGGGVAGTINAGDKVYFQIDTSGGSTGSSYVSDVGSNFIAFELVDSGGPSGGGLVNTRTRIISMSPEDGEVVDIGGAPIGNVDFDLHAYINEDDIGDFLTIKIIFRNIDQNTLLNAPCTSSNVGLECSQYSFDIFRGVATTSGDFYFASSTNLAKGNYRVEASLDTATNFGGINLGFFTIFGSVSDTLNHQFIVGSSTWIGNISQNIFGQTDSFFGTLPATSSEAMASTCNPLNSQFGIRECLGFLFIPDAGQLNDTMVNFRDGVLIRPPWGYLTRFIVILNGTTTTSLPGISIEFDPDGPLGGVTWEVSPSDIISAGGTFMDNMEDRNGNTFQEVAEPIIKLIVGLALVLQIVHDITGSHAHHNSANKKQT